MGCCAQEDKGMDKVRGRVTGGGDSITDAEMCAMMKDANADLKQIMMLNVKCFNLPNLDK